MDLEALTLRVKRNENLPVLSQVAGTVLRMADDPRTGAKDLERTIERDMALASKILKVANSSYYGTSNVSSISRGVSILGINTVKSLVVSLAYQQMISGRLQSQKFQRTEFWSHSLGVAITARVICKMMIPQKAEEMYLAGLMHDVGLLVLDRFLPQELDQALKVSAEERIPLFEAEQRILGYDHAQVGGLLTQQWGLSAPIVNAISYQTNIAGDETTRQTTSIIAVANDLSHQAGLHNQEPNVAHTPDIEAREALGVTDEQLEVIGVVMVQEVMKAQAAFQIQVAA